MNGDVGKTDCSSEEYLSEHVGAVRSATLRENLDRPIRRQPNLPGLGGRRSKHANDSHGGLLSPANEWKRNKGAPLGGLGGGGRPNALTGRSDLPAASGT